MSTPLRQRMLQDLQLAGLSERTQEAYLRGVRKLAEFYGASPDQLEEEQLRQYYLHLKNERKLSASALKQAHYGIKFFYTHTVIRKWPVLDHLRVPAPQTLPDVLTIEQVRRIVSAVNTPHNRTYLWTVYSLGLRLQEGLNLQVGDIDSAQMRVHVHRGKGAKDRYVPLPPSTLDMLRQWWSVHRHPQWLFPALGRSRQGGPTAKTPMGIASVQGAMKRAVNQVGVRQRVSIHTLRHSYATHLLESGVNLRLIQKYLGHRNLATTAQYLHLTEQGQEKARATINALMAEESHADRR